MAETPIVDVDVALSVGALDLRVRFTTAARRIAIVGPSGAGKSMLLRILAGLEPATGRLSCRGQVWLDSEAGIRMPPWERKLGWVPQDARLFPHQSIRENLGFGGAAPAAITAMAERLGVAHLLDRMPRHLSGGEAQRVALGRALLAKPRLLLLDEPFASLDRKRRETVSAMLRSLLDESDVPLVLVSHDDRDVAMCDEIFEMADGVLGKSGGREV